LSGGLSSTTSRLTFTVVGCAGFTSRFICAGSDMFFAPVVRPCLAMVALCIFARLQPIRQTAEHISVHRRDDFVNMIRGTPRNSGHPQDADRRPM
jgi:hypothetical protein